MTAANEYKSAGSAVIDYRDSVVDFEGDVVKTSKVVGGTANEDDTLTMTCPTGLRMDKVEFASFGTPTVGNDETVTNCDGTSTPDGFAFSTFALGSCVSDADQVPFFTKDIVEKYCLGQTSCSVPARTSIFGDPCPSKSKWLSASVRCSDRYITKDYIEANGVAQKLTGSAYSFGAWVYPRTKAGIQAILSFGSIVQSSVLNAGLIQFKSDGAKGVFYYYDDCIYDVAMKDSATGADFEVDVNKWYHVMVTISSANEGSLYLDGVKRASFSTTCRPKSDGTGSFVMGMDMDDLMFPKEYFDGLMDDVRVYDTALTEQEMATAGSCYTSFKDLGNLVAYFNFNNGTGDFATDVVGNVKGTFSSSSETTYDTAAQSFVGSSDIHATYKYAGVPWYPAYLSKVSSSSGPLRGGNTITLEGVNFAEESTILYQSETQTGVNYVSDKEIEVTMGVSTTMDEVGGAFTVQNDEYGCTLESTYLSSSDAADYTQELAVDDIQTGLSC